MMFNEIDRNNGDVYKLNRYRMDNNDSEVLYDYWYAYTDPSSGNTTYTHNPPTTLILLQNVQSMYITAIDSNPTTNVQIDIVQSKQLLNGDTSQVMISTTTFNIKTRNLK